MPTYRPVDCNRYFDDCLHLIFPRTETRRCVPLIRQNNIRQTINNENVLKVLYQLGEENKNFSFTGILTRLSAEKI